MSIKIGDSAWICKVDEMIQCHLGETVTVKGIDKLGGRHPIKVQNGRGDIFYVHPNQLRKPNQAATKKETRKIRKQAEKLAEEKMKVLEKENRKGKDMNEVKEVSKKANFLDVIKEFGIVYKIQNDQPLDADEKNKLIDVLGDYIFDSIKDGVTR